LLLEGDLSLEQVTGLMKDKGKVIVSHETIYQYVWGDKSRVDDFQPISGITGRNTEKEMPMSKN